MPAFPKIRNKSVSVLKKAYLDDEMSTVEISKESRKLFGFYVTPATVFNSLVRYGCQLRSKGNGVSKAKRKTMKLSRIVKTDMERWNARWLIATGQIKCNKSTVRTGEVKKLRKMLDQALEVPLVPQKLILNEFMKARKEGFPFDDLSEEEKMSDWSSLLKAKIEKVDGAYSWSGRETRLATSFHPHFYSCRKKGRMSPIEFFESDEDLKRGIFKILCLYGSVNKSRLREICRNENASSPINNFPPRVVMALLQEALPGRNDIRLLDPCTGFGGRLLGCAASHKVVLYNGIDMAEKTIDGLKETEKFLKQVGNEMEMKFICEDCNEAMPRIKDQFDVIMTSPPFLDMEEYEGVEVEHDYKRWIKVFVKTFVNNCYERLTKGGKLMIYSENINSKQPFTNDFMAIAKQAYFCEDAPVLFKKSRATFQRRYSATRIFPIYVWVKK